MTRADAKKMIKDEFSDNRAIAAMLLRQMDTKEKSLKWNRNVRTFHQKDQGNTFHFDLDMRSEKDNVYHLIAENGPENWNFEEYQKIFPNQKKENMVILKNCSHFLHDEKPKETKKYLLRFLDHIDACEA